MLTSHAARSLDRSVLFFLRQNVSCLCFFGRHMISKANFWDRSTAMELSVLTKLGIQDVGVSCGSLCQSSSSL